jgi:threonine synthase
LEEFIDFLPLSEGNAELSLGEGRTSLTRLRRIENRLKLPLLWAKNEFLNPTSSFKDRGTAVAVQKAVSMGIKWMGTVSTGNMASSTAAYGAKAGLKTCVLLKEDISTEKLPATAVFNPLLVSVKGDYGDLFYKSFDIGRKYKIYFANSVDPNRIEGYKAIGFEIFLQLDHKAPDAVFVPVSSGGHLIGVMRAFLDLKSENMIQELPCFIGVQAEGCSPIAKAYNSGKTKVERIEKGKTLAHAISNPDPPGGNILLKMIRDSGGMILDVTDEEILEAQKILAELEGIFCAPASATTLAGLLKISRERPHNLRRQNALVITGSGLKAIKSLDLSDIQIFNSSLIDLEEKIGSLAGE